MSTQIPRVIADLELQLATAVAIAGTSFTLSSATDDDGQALPAGIYVFSVDSGTSNKEYLLGQLNGTAVTSVKSVSRQGVQTSGAARAHRVGAPVILTNFAALQLVADTLRGVVGLDGSSPLIYDTAPTLSDGKELATVQYVIDTVSGGTVAFDAQTITGTGGAAIVAGNLVYFKTSDQEWYPTDADTLATVEGVQLGIALGTGSDGVGITGGIQIAGTYTTTGLTAGSLYYASNTVGAYTTSAGTNSQIIGIALSTTKLLLIPRNPQTVSTNEKAALVGDAAPSSVNKFLTKGKSVTAGASISGATTPVPVYQNKTDNEFYACDANDTAAMKFIGFAISNGTDGAAMNVQFSGIVSGFTGLSEGEKYYVQDAVGTIGTSIGTYEILVGIAISETELLIQKGRRRAGGVMNDLGTASGSQAITCGFRPSVIRLNGYTTVASTDIVSGVSVVWVNGSLNAASFYNNGGGTENNVYNTARLSNNNTSDYVILSIGSITDTGFTISWTETGTYTGPEYVVWEAEGEL